jgi:hypothetical protein
MNFSHLFVITCCQFGANDISPNSPLNSDIRRNKGVDPMPFRRAIRSNYLICLAAFALILFFALPAYNQANQLQRYSLEFGDFSIAVAPSTTVLNLENTLTLEAWVLLADRPKGGGGVIMGKVHDTRAIDPFYSWVLQVSTELRPEFIQTTGAAGSYITATSPNPLAMRTWTHIAGVLGEGVMQLYVNGVKVASQTSPGLPENGTLPFAIGGGAQTNNTTCCGLSGALRQVAVWNRALSPSEINGRVTSVLTGNESGLLAYWPLDDGAGQVARDLGRNHLPLQMGFSSSPEFLDPRWVHSTTIAHGPYFDFAQPNFDVLPNCWDASKGLPCLNHGRLINLNRVIPDVVSTTWFVDFSNAPLKAISNDGTGNFREATSSIILPPVPTTQAASEVLVADFTGDSRQDLFIADSGPDREPFPGGYSKLLVQKTDGTLLDESNSRIPSSQGFWHCAIAGDFRHSGSLDIYAGAIGPGSPAYLVNDGQGHFRNDPGRLPSSVVNLTTRYTGCLAIDVNNDGWLDIALGTMQYQNSQDVLLINNQTGKFNLIAGTLPTHQTGPDGITKFMHSADFDGDGWNDIVEIQSNPDFSGDRIVLLLNNKDGTFRDATNQIPQLWNSVLFTGLGQPWPADINKDGNIDILAEGCCGLTQPRLFLNTGNAQFIDASEILPFGFELAWNTTLAGDLNKDSLLDLFGSGGSGFGVALNLKNFTSFSDLAPGKATLTSPSGSNSNAQPTYTWKAVPSATWYLLWVSSNGTPIMQKWYTAAQSGCISGIGTCSVKPDITLPSGSAQWYIQPWNAAGYGAWSDGMIFAVAGASLPEKTTLIAPVGTISTTTPTYKWNAAATATWYYLWVDDSNGNRVKSWFTALQAGCAAGTGTCSVTPATSISPGAALWWVQTWNDAGYGPWSDGMPFSVQAGGLPGAAVLVAPSGTIATKSPTFAWNAVPAATWYYLWVNDGGVPSPRIQQWFTVAQAGCGSGSGICSVAPGIVLSSGASQWWIQTWNDAGYGPWSTRMAFTVP